MRWEVEAGNISAVRDILEELRPLGPKAKQCVAFSYDGYNDVPKEIYEIDDIRHWCERVLQRYPYIFYYLTPFPGGAAEFAACIGDLEIYRPLYLRKPVPQLLEEGLPLAKIPVRISLPDKFVKLIAEATMRYGTEEMGEPEAAIRKLIAEIPGMPESIP